MNPWNKKDAEPVNVPHPGSPPPGGGSIEVVDERTNSPESPGGFNSSASPPYFNRSASERSSSATGSDSSDDTPKVPVTPLPIDIFDSNPIPVSPARQSFSSNPTPIQTGYTPQYVIQASPPPAEDSTPR